MEKKSPRIHPFITETTLAKRVAELGAAISRDFGDERLVVVGVLKGAFIFLADLVRHIKSPLRIEFIGVASYEGTASTGHVQITRDLTADIKGQNVLLVEDIVDTGKTLDFLLDTLRVRSPKSISLCALLSKPEAHQMRAAIDYLGFEIGNEFVVGYGLDYNGDYREVPFVGKLDLNP